MWFNCFSGTAAASTDTVLALQPELKRTMNTKGKTLYEYHAFLSRLEPLFNFRVGVANKTDVKY
jgi:hypothetical protein